MHPKTQDPDLKTRCIQLNDLFFSNFERKWSTQTQSFSAFLWDDPYKALLPQITWIVRAMLHQWILAKIAFLEFIKHRHLHFVSFKSNLYTYTSTLVQTLYSLHRSIILQFLCCTMAWVIWDHKSWSENYWYLTNHLTAFSLLCSTLEHARILHIWWKIQSNDPLSSFSEKVEGPWNKIIYFLLLNNTV